MTKAVVGAMALCVAFATAAPAAPKAKPRTESTEYKQPAIGATTPVVYAWRFDCMKQEGCVLVPVREGDRTLSIRIADATGLPVYGQLRNPGAANEVVAHVYGETDHPLRVGGPALLALHIVAGIAPNGELSTPTKGEVELTFNERGVD